jgi:hypothetical protein
MVSSRARVREAVPLALHGASERLLSELVDAVAERAAELVLERLGQVPMGCRRRT